MKLSRKQKKMLTRIVIAAVMMVGLKFFPDPDPMDVTAPWLHYIKLALYIVAYLVIGYDILRKAGLGIVNGRVFDENFLMAVATLGAFGLALVEHSGEYEEAIAVMLFYQIGEFFQNYAVGKSRKSISELMDIRPDYANVERTVAADTSSVPTGNSACAQLELVRVDPASLPIGSVIVIQPGEKVPIDGIVVEGTSHLNTSALTGESLPRECGPGAEVLSGCINMNGVLKVRTTKEFGESTASRILDLVENSSSNKSHSEDFISRFARYYTPVVCFGALALALIPPFVTLVANGQSVFDIWLYRALTFLVISCPCALVISIPLSFFAGIGGASRQGIMIKGSNYLEALSKINTVAMDKTGTLTKGVFEVVDIHHSPIEPEQVIEFAALAESSSSHPISKSIQHAYGKKLDRSRVSNIEEISGEGVIATVDGHSVAVGNAKLMQRLGLEFHPCHCTGTIVHLGLDGVYAGHIVVSDVVKETSAKAVEDMRSTGIKRVIMLTGDSRKVAASVAGELGIDQYYSELLPSGKVELVDSLISGGEAAGGVQNVNLAFVGDGINDAPVLARAHVGIAMGALGSDAAIEASDVIIMDDDPLKISKSIRIARKCMNIVYQNIVFALAVKLLFLVLGAFGIANMWMAIFADTGIMILAVLNALRALRVK